MLAAAAFAAVLSSAALPPPPFCAKPERPLDSEICKDPDTLRLAAFNWQIINDIWNKDWALGADLNERMEWPKTLDACATLACAREAYQARLRGLVDAFYSDGLEVPIRNPKLFRGPHGKDNWSHLLIKDFGDGWIFFWVDAGYAVGPRDAPSDRTNWAAGVVPLKNGRASWRNAEGGGVDLERRGGGWRVTQVGHSVCEDCAFDVDVSGDFHRTHIRFPSVSGPY